MQPANQNKLETVALSGKHCKTVFARSTALLKNRRLASSELDSGLGCLTAR